MRGQSVFSRDWISVPLDIDLALLLLGHIREFGFHGLFDFELLAGVINDLVRMRHQATDATTLALQSEVPKRWHRDPFPPVLLDDLLRSVVLSATDGELWTNDKEGPILGMYPYERSKSIFGRRVKYASQKAWGAIRKASRSYDFAELGLANPRRVHFNGEMLLSAASDGFDFRDPINLSELTGENCISFITGGFVDPLLRMMEEPVDFSHRPTAKLRDEAA